MNIEHLKEKSFTTFIESNMGKGGVEFYAELYEENPENFIELTTEINKLLIGKIVIESVNVKDDSFEIKTDKGNRNIEFDTAIILGLRGSLEDMQLLYFRILNDILLESGFDERLIIYYDELIPDIHWIGLINKDKSHFLLKFIDESKPEECKEFTVKINDGPRVLGIGIADEDKTKYSELVIFP